MKINTGFFKFGLLIILFLLLIPDIHGQYFSRNKPSYRAFDFKIKQTPHFSIYNYLENDSLEDVIAQWAEEWYTMHQKFFKDTFNTRNPIVLYSNAADFQQTNAVEGSLGIGTGGVTESVKNRVIIPVSSTLAQTDHVLGHEMVHAFQFHMLINEDSAGTQMSYQNIPLWMIEGMAEYLSIGSVDPNTAMWMRDALLNDKFPTIKQLTNDPEFFPYRYGQAFWALIGKTWGDTIILPLFNATAYMGYERAFRELLKVGADNLSSMWKSAMEVHYNKYLSDSFDSLAGKKLISKENAGSTNISPSISPDGRYVAFFSEKDVFTLDLYLADASSGKIIKQLSSIVHNDEIDEFSFIESSGTWSPDGKQFAFVVFSKGVNKIVIVDVDKAKIKQEIEINGVPAINNPVWSPDGGKILFAGMVEGVVDLYTYDLNTKELKQITNDWLSNIHPSWSSDGKFITYSTERINKGVNEAKYGFDIMVLETETGISRNLNVFPGAVNVNPVFYKNDIYFLSDRDGFRNMYKYEMSSGKVYRMTKYPTGISGITAYSPAISISPATGEIAYTYYYGDGYQIYLANESEFKPVEVNKTDIDMAAGTLPPVEYLEANVVDYGLYNRNDDQLMPVDSFSDKPYRAKLQLDDISNVTSTGVSAGRYGTNMAGSVSMSFSDMLGNNQLLTALSINGEVYDFGGQFAYINQKHKLKYGGLISHIPYRYGSLYLKRDTILYQGQSVVANNFVLDYLRLFEDNFSLFSYYPVSTTRRFEAGISTSFYYYRIDRYNNYYNDYGSYLGYDKEKVDAPKGFNLQEADVAYVEDNSYFGMTSPLRGHRMRLQTSKYFGDLGFYSLLADYRKYFFLNPLSFAVRMYHYGRYGGGSDNQLMSPVYIGYPWLVRGYDSKEIYQDENGNTSGFNIDNLFGTRMMIGNLELRLPFTGPEQLAIIKSRYLGTDLNLFFDAGIAWDEANKPFWTKTGQRDPVYSTGISLRVNVLGYIVLEPYYAFPLQNGGFKNGGFGLNITPGW